MAASKKPSSRTPGTRQPAVNDRPNRQNPGRATNPQTNRVAKGRKGK